MSRDGCSSFSPAGETVAIRVRADCGGRLFTAKLRVVVHYLPHQLLDHLLADEAILLACQFSDRLGDRVGGSTDGPVLL